eukprot:gene15235-biopygen8152
MDPSGGCQRRVDEEPSSAGAHPAPSQSVKKITVEDGGTIHIKARQAYRPDVVIKQFVSDPRVEEITEMKNGM